MAKLITAIIKRSRLDPVRTALEDIGTTGLTMCEVNGYGRQGGQTETYRGVEYRSGFIQKLRLDIVIADDRVDETLEAIMDAAWTGNVGDGKMWVTHIEEVVRIRTRERGDSAV